MDKYEYKVRADEIKELIARGEYPQAAEIADTIDWRRVKSVMMLCTISDLYKINRRYEDAKNMLLRAYETIPGGKKNCYSHCDLFIKTEEFVQAENYYKEFVQVAPKDPGRYILQYKLYEAQDVSLEERIGVLEELKKRDYREKWAYELAYLYHRVGLATRCVEECDELILWFGEGKYVIKAMELKMLHQPLTPAQQEKYDHRFDGWGVQQEAPAAEASSEVQTGWEASAEEQGTQKATEEVLEKPEEPFTAQETGEQPEEMDIQVKTIDVGQYNTINLQAELAAGLKEVLDGERSKQSEAITRSILAPLMDSDTESLDLPEIDEVDESDLGPETEVMEGSEVFFGETGDLSSLQQENIVAPEGMEEILPAEPENESTESASEAAEQLEETQAFKEKDTTQESVDTTTDDTAEKVMHQLRMESVESVEEQALTAQPPKELAGVLSQESDGQISLVVPESETIEKQITGQMSIEDILAEWERMKKENEEKRKEEVRQHVLQQTGTMFTEFEASVRDGLLEQLEREKTVDIPEDTEDIVEETGESEETEEAEFAEEPVEEAAEAEAEEAAMPEEAEFAEEPVEEAAEAEAEEAAMPEEAELTEEPEEEPEEAVTEEVGENAEVEGDSEDDYGEVEEIEEIEEAEEEQPSYAPAEREKVKVRAMTKEERELYAPFIQSRSGREKLVKAIDNISMAAYTGNIVITGEERREPLAVAI